MKRFFVVESDCLGIVERLKQIDQDYFLVYDLDKKKFELYSKGAFVETHCLTFPFDEIDERMIDMTIKTKVQNSDALFEEIERENEKRRKQIISTTLNTFKESFYDS